MEECNYQKMWRELKQLVINESEVVYRNLKELLKKELKTKEITVPDVAELADHKYSLETYTFILEKIEEIEEENINK